jgi:hypothetical protein
MLRSFIMGDYNFAFLCLGDFLHHNYAYQTGQVVMIMVINIDIC